MKFIFFAIILSYTLLLACNTKVKIDTDTTYIFGDTIHIETTNGEFSNLLIVDTQINDSTPMKALFDTGGGTGVVITEKLKDLKKNDSIQISIGNSAYNCPKSHITTFPKKQVKRINDNHGLIGWFIFEGKLIEISMKNNFMREVLNHNYLQEFDSITMNRKGPYLSIPITISMQGVIITEDLLLDTGFNGSISLNYNLISDYGIDVSEKGNETLGYSNVTVDSIWIGQYPNNSLITQLKHQSSFMGKNGRAGHNYPFSGLIGMDVLHNFRIILDLKNHVFYYKLENT